MENSIFEDLKKRLCRIPFPSIWNSRCRHDDGGDSACPPIPPLRWAMMT